MEYLLGNAVVTPFYNVPQPSPLFSSYLVQHRVQISFSPQLLVALCSGQLYYASAALELSMQDFFAMKCYQVWTTFGKVVGEMQRTQVLRCRSVVLECMRKRCRLRDRSACTEKIFEWPAALMALAIPQYVHFRISRVESRGA